MPLSGQKTRVDPRRVQTNTMQTAMVRLYDEPSCRRMTIEAPISRTKAMEEILTGLRAATERELDWEAALFMHWAGYDRYRIAAPLEKQHLTHIQLSYGIGAQRVEYVFPGGLVPVECDDLCWQLNDDLGKAQKREWLVASTLAGMLHGDGVSLADYAVVFARGKTARDGDIVVESATPPTTLYTAVYDLGWSTTAAWLRNIHTTLKQGLDTIREGHAVWIPASARRQPWEPLIFRPCQDHLRLSLGAEAAAYAGYRMEIVVSDTERADWLSDGEAASLADMKQGRWRRWIETNLDVRVGRPIAKDGRPAKNRRLIHRGDLRRALRLANAHAKDGGDVCMGAECPQRCWKTRDCPHRDHDCPAR